MAKKCDCAYVPGADFQSPIKAVNYLKMHAGETPDKVAIAWEREDGLVARYDLLFPKRLSPVAEKGVLNVAERAAKFLLWAAGGWKLTLAGPDRICQAIAKAYTKKGARAFDYDFMSGVYDRPMEARVVPMAKMPAAHEKTVTLKNNTDGCRIGFDLGASDFKISALKNGKVVFSQEFPWDPRNNPDPEYHYTRLNEGLEAAVAALPRVDAIGGSTAGVVVANRIRTASLFRAIKEQNPGKYAVAQNMFQRLQEEWQVPVEVANDGDVTALAGVITMNKKGILGLAMGSSEAVGYVTPKGALTGRITELAFAPVDLNPNAPKDEWSGDAGVGAMYFSQQAVDFLARAYGFKFPQAMKLPERLKVVQAAMEKGDEKALKVYLMIGRYLANAVPWYREFYDFSNLMILGRVTSGLGGEVILETARMGLQALDPAMAEEVEIFMPDEKARRLGQSVAAAQIPVIRK